MDKNVWIVMANSSAAYGEDMQVYAVAVFDTYQEAADYAQACREHYADTDYDEFFTAGQEETSYYVTRARHNPKGEA